MTSRNYTYLFFRLNKPTGFMALGWTCLDSRHDSLPMTELDSVPSLILLLAVSLAGPKCRRSEISMASASFPGVDRRRVTLVTASVSKVTDRGGFQQNIRFY